MKCTSQTFNGALAVFSYVPLRFTAHTTSRLQKMFFTLHTRHKSRYCSPQRRSTRLHDFNQCTRHRPSAFLSSWPVTLLHYFISTNSSSSGYCGDNLSGDCSTLSLHCPWRLHYTFFTLPLVPAGYCCFDAAFVPYGKTEATTQRRASTSLNSPLSLVHQNSSFFFSFWALLSPRNTPVPYAQPCSLSFKLTLQQLQSDTTTVLYKLHQHTLAH